jgi:hypothetical protein
MASFGAKYNKGGPWATQRGVHQIKGGGSRARSGGLKVTDKQKSLLQELGYNGPWDITRIEATDAIQILIHRKNRTTKR